MNPALAGGFFTSEPPGKPCTDLYLRMFLVPKGNNLSLCEWVY